MPNFIDYGISSFDLDIRKLEQWALEREQHEEIHHAFLGKLSDKICAIEKKLESDCGAKNNGWNHAAVIKPSKDGYYLCYNESFFEVMEFFSDHWYKYGASGAIGNISKLWWMSLPEPPVEVSDESEN